MKLMVYGAGGQGRVLMRLAQEINAADGRWEEIIAVDDVTAERSVMGLRVLKFSEVEKDFNPGESEFVISLGEPKNRIALYNKVKQAGFRFCGLIDPNKNNIKYSRFGEGVVVSNYVTVSNNVTVGNNVYLLNACAVGHDSVVGDHSFIGSGAVIGGRCSIGSGTFIGTNASIKENTKIGSNVIVGMGSCVFRDLPDGAKVIGNPAQIIPNFSGSNVFS